MSSGLYGLKKMWMVKKSVSQMKIKSVNEAKKRFYNLWNAAYYNKHIKYECILYLRTKKILKIMKSW